MNTDFPRIISLLRKERNISQKQAAADLGVSQALLSHYEKGIRECGLDFIVKAADYYNVSCDYLLGRSPEPSGRIILSEPDTASAVRHSAAAERSVKLISDSADVLLSIAERSGEPSLIRAVSDYLMLAVYRLFRIIYSSNPANDKRFFAVPEASSDALANAAMSVSRASVSSVRPSSGQLTPINSAAMSITTASLSSDYPENAPSLLNAVRESERIIISMASGLQDGQKK